MRKQYFVLLAGIFTINSLLLRAQDTYSIVAADSATREVGSAGASCVDLFTTSFNDHFIGELFPNKGAINTQAAYISTNQANARTRMNAGDTPAQIITWLTTPSNDVQGNPSVRQYGIVGFIGNNVSAKAFTGNNCTNYKGHVTGSINGIHYSIQGNILLGKKVLDSMEARFRREPGDIRCRLMAALQGANMVGADTRCAPNNSSALFAYVKVSKPNEPFNTPSFLVSVRTRNNAKIEPVDSLQKKFDKVYSCKSPTGISDDAISDGVFRIFPNPASDKITILSNSKADNIVYTLSDALGRQVYSGRLSGETTIIDIEHLAAGIYVLQLGQADKQTFRVVKN